MCPWYQPRESIYRSVSQTSGVSSVYFRSNNPLIKNWYEYTRLTINLTQVLSTSMGDIAYTSIIVNTLFLAWCPCYQSNPEFASTGFFQAPEALDKQFHVYDNIPKILNNLMCLICYMISMSYFGGVNRYWNSQPILWQSRKSRSLYSGSPFETIQHLSPNKPQLCELVAARSRIKVVCEKSIATNRLNC